jgi:hypothetical protein
MGGVTAGAPAAAVIVNSKNASRWRTVAAIALSESALCGYDEKEEQKKSRRKA